MIVWRIRFIWTVFHSYPLWILESYLTQPVSRNYGCSYQPGLMAGSFNCDDKTLAICLLLKKAGGSNKNYEQSFRCYGTTINPSFIFCCSGRRAGGASRSKKRIKRSEVA